VPNSCRPEHELPDDNPRRGKEGIPNFRSAEPATESNNHMEKLN